MKKIFPALALLAVFSQPSFAAGKVENPIDPLPVKECLSTREYVTTLKYLEERKEFQLQKDQARKIADQVSLACTGGAERFIRVMNTLLKAEIDSKTALSSSLKLATAGKENTDAFIEIFKSAFLEKLLDRDAQASYKIAMNFAQDFKGDLNLASKNFFAVASYCSEEGKINLAKNRCMESSQKIAKLSGQMKQDLSKNFFKLIEFLMNASEANLPLFKALEISERVMENGNLAVDNFIEGFHFAMAKDGLALGVSEAISFAEKMASRSLKN